MEENPKAATQIDEVVETRLAQSWLLPGERLILACPPIRAHVGAVIAGHRLVPYVPHRELPAVQLTPPRWPLPMSNLLPNDWVDDPTLGHWVTADHDGQDAVRCADHLAGSHGEARVVVTDRRVAVVYPTELLTEMPRNDAFTTFEEMAADHLARIEAPFVGRSAPPRRVVGFTFADGSTLYSCDVHAAMKVRRAADRARARDTDRGSPV